MKENDVQHTYTSNILFQLILYLQVRLLILRQDRFVLSTRAIVRIPSLQ